MEPAHAGAGLEIGKRAGDAHHPVIAPRRELEAVGRRGEQLAALGIGGGDFVEELAVGLGIAADLLASVAPGLDLPRRGDAGGHLPAALARRGQSEIGGAHRRAEATSLGLRILAVPPYGASPVCSKPGSQTKEQAPVRHGDIPLRRSAVDPDIPKTPLAQLLQQLPVASAPIPGHDEFRQPAEPKTENGAKTAGSRRARSFRVPMRCRTSLAFSAGQTIRARPPWRCPARVQVIRPEGDVLRTLGYIPIHALIPFAGITVWHRNHPPAVGALRAKPLFAQGLEIYTH